MGAGIQRWWRDPDRLQHECDAFDGKEPELAEHVKWFRDHQFEWALQPLVPEPQFIAPEPLSDEIQIRLRSWMQWCSCCQAYFAQQHWHCKATFFIA